MNGHTIKISRPLATDTNIDEDIKEHVLAQAFFLSFSLSFFLSFFQKLVFWPGLNFALSPRISSREIHANFKQSYCKLEPNLKNDNKELAAAILHVLALILQ